jgi:hypothetical protein
MAEGQRYIIDARQTSGLGIIPAPQVDADAPN